MAEVFHIIYYEIWNCPLYGKQADLKSWLHFGSDQLGMLEKQLVVIRYQIHSPALKFNCRVAGVRSP